MNSRAFWRRTITTPTSRSTTCAYARGSNRTRRNLPLFPTWRSRTLRKITRALRGSVTRTSLNGSSPLHASVASLHRPLTHAVRCGVCGGDVNPLCQGFVVCRKTSQRARVETMYTYIYIYKRHKSLARFERGTSSIVVLRRVSRRMVLYVQSSDLLKDELELV